MSMNGARRSGLDGLIVPLKLTFPKGSPTLTRGVLNSVINKSDIESSSV